jgi:hypothetical protein
MLYPTLGEEDSLTLKPADNFYAALQAAGLPAVPREFAVLPQHQIIPSNTMAEICEFIRVFDEVTARAAWQAAALREAPAIAQLRRNEVCFFSALDFHLAPTGEWQLIEFNDNGSGFIFAAIINALYYEAAELEREKRIAAPDQVAAFKRRIGDLVEREAVAFFKKYPDCLFLVLDDAESLQRGKFFQELQLLNDLFCQHGWQSEIAGPSELQWNGQTLLCNGRAVSFIVNRSTDFFWQSKVFSALCKAYQAGQVCIAPNPFTYATRSGSPCVARRCRRERPTVAAPSSPRPANPCRGLKTNSCFRSASASTFSVRIRCVSGTCLVKIRRSAGSISNSSSQCGSDSHSSSRLSRYIAQRWAPKAYIQIDDTALWTDLRVWAYRGEILQVSGQASRRPDRLDLAPPGGWLPTYVSI